MTANSRSDSESACGCAEHERAAGLSRRGLLGRTLAVGAGAALAGLVGEGLSTQLAFGAVGVQRDVLVVLSLRGGFDGLSAIVPAGDADYYRARPTIGVPRAQLVGGDAMFGLHPALAPLVPLWEAGKLAAVHAVGQPNPTRSHFKAMEELERAAAGTQVRTGWLDRMLGVCNATVPLNGVSVGSCAMPASLAGPAPKLGMTSIERFALAGDSSWTPMAATLRGLYSDAPSVLTAAGKSVLDALPTVRTVAAQPYTPAGGAAYPATPLGAALKDVARLIKARVGLLVASVDFGDWDMHEGLGTPLAGQRMYDHLKELAQALSAFATDLGSGLSGVTLLTLSEFGRRVQENGSRGTDHGHGNAMLLLGGGVRGRQVYGTWPGLAPQQLVGGDLAATTDYRAVLGEVLQKRCGVGSLTQVFPGVAAGSLGLVRARA